jgi:excisionase family DNA binding protein
MQCMDTKPKKLAYSKQETAYLLGVSVGLVDQLLSARRIKCFRIGKRVLVAHQALLAFIKQNSAEDGDAAQ